MATEIKKNLTKSPQKLEEKILKAIFKSKDCILEVIDIITPSTFTISDYGAIYSAMVELYKQDSNINVETVQLYLEENHTDVNPNVIKKLYNEGFTSLAVADTAIVLKKLYQRRFILEKLRGILDDQEQSPTEFNDLLEDVNDVVLKSNELVLNNDKDTKYCNNVDDILSDVYLKLQDKYEDEGLKTGFSVIDDNLGGLKQGHLWTICADSQVGKSMFALELVLQTCRLNPDIHALYYSLEMTQREQEVRGLGMITNIEPSHIDNPKKYFIKFDERTGRVVDDLKNSKVVEDYKYKLRSGLEELKSYNICVDDTPDYNTQTLEASIRKYFLKQGRVDLIVVDHMNILCSGTVSEEVSKLKEGYATLKKLAKKFKCTIICLHQFSNELKNDALRKPNIFNLIGGSAPRHFSDVIVGLWRPGIYPEVVDNNPELKDHCELIWQKVRGAKKPDSTLMDFNGFLFIEKEPDGLQGDIISGEVFLTPDGSFISNTDR